MDRKKLGICDGEESEIFQFVLMSSNWLLGFTADSSGGYPPASSNNTFHSGISLKRFATTAPADPAPTTMKSYRSPSELKILSDESIFAINDRKYYKKINTPFANIPWSCGHIWGEVSIA